MIEKIFSAVAGLSLIVGCSLAMPGLRASAAPKDKDDNKLVTGGCLASGSATLRASELADFDAHGSAIVVHAGEDDNMTDPTRNSGDRIACGIIVAR